MSERAQHETPRYDALIVGGGPAGASCALWLKLLGHRPLLVDQAGRLGGLQRLSPYPNEWIPGRRYASGTDFADSLEAHLREQQVEVRLKTTLREIVRDEERSIYRAHLGPSDVIEAPFLVMATGVVPRPPDFPQTSNVDVIVGPGKQIFERDFHDSRVAILGGGDNAFENYLFVSRQGPAAIRIFARSIRARYDFVSRVPKDDIHFGPYRVDIEGRRVEDFEFDTALVFYGWECNNPAERFLLIERANGFVKTDGRRLTNIDSVYAIGEMTLTTHPCVVTSMADGVIAAKDIQERLDVGRVNRLLHRPAPPSQKL